MRRIERTGITGTASARLLVAMGIVVALADPFMPFALAESPSTNGGNKHGNTATASASKTTAAAAKTTNPATSSSTNANTAVNKQAKAPLQAGASKSRKLRPLPQAQEVWGNGLKPDPYVPNAGYTPSPPANKAIHPVSSNAR